MKYINEGFKVALCLILVSAFGFIALALTTIWSDKATAQTQKTQAYYEKAQEVIDTHRKLLGQNIITQMF